VCTIGSKAVDDTGSTRTYPEVEEFQKKAKDSEKIGRNWRSFEAKYELTR